MVLLAAALAVILGAKSASKPIYSPSDAAEEMYFRETNAKLENKILLDFMKDGDSFDEAYEKAKKAIVEHGFEPCITKTNYKEHASMTRGPLNPPYMIYLLQSPALSEADSDYINLCKRYVHQCIENKTIILQEGETEDKYIYPPEVKGNKFAKSMHVDKLMRQASLRPIGSLCVYPGWGTCEVIGYGRFGMYKIKSCKTGKTTSVGYEYKAVKWL